MTPGDRRGRGSAGGKAIVLGEHAVVHGAPALAVGLPLEIRATATCRPGPAVLCVRDWGYRVRPGDGSRGAAALEALAGALRVDLEGAHVEARSAIPPGAGLGSSAALAAAVARALTELHGRPSSFESLFAATQASERVFHGNPSGLDATAALLGGTLRFTRDGGGDGPLDLAPPRLVVALSGEPGDTRAAVARFARRLAERPDDGRARLKRVAELVDAGQRALVEDDLAALGAAMDENHRVLRWFGVSTPALDRVCEIAREAGAAGAKLTGGGGGGAAIALVDEGAEAPVAAALEAAGFRVVLP